MDEWRTCSVVAAYESAYTEPLVFSAGEAVAVSEKESEWSGWLWCTNRAGKSRWVPEKYVKRTGAACVLLCDYEATELSVSVGEALTMEKEESGWIWCTNQAGQSGWVPADHVVAGEDER
jgi:uncharacterized protein YgiM (DUF1202 family)